TLEGNAFHELVRRIRSGEDGAAAELVSRYEPTVRRIARVRLADERLRCRFDSMDICQSVFASFFARAALGQFDLERPEQLVSLLVRLSRRNLVDRAREEGAARRDYRRQHPEGIADLDFVQGGDSPSVEVETAELLREFRKRLSDDERAIAEQRALGRNWDQIAADRGGSPEAIRKQLTRAIDRVGRELGMDGFPTS